MSDFKVGDRVRRSGGSEVHTVIEVKPRSASHSNMPDEYAAYVITDKAPYGIWTQYVGLAPEPVAVPPIEEYDSPIEEAVIRRTEAISAALRKRKQEIARLREEILTLRKAVTETEARVLAGPMIAATDLGKIAAQLGLTAEQAEQALEFGAYALATGLTRQDVRRFRTLAAEINNRG